MRSWGLILRCALVVTVFMMTRDVVAGQNAAVKGDSSAAGVSVFSGQTGGPVSLKVGAVLEVRLESNHTTGYSWIVAPVGGPVLMRQGAAKYEEHASGGKAGVGGVEIWRFKAMKTGKQGLQFEYRRPWEKDAPAAKIVTYSVTVE